MAAHAPKGGEQKVVGRGLKVVPDPSGFVGDDHMTTDPALLGEPSSGKVAHSDRFLGAIRVVIVCCTEVPRYRLTQAASTCAT